MKEKKFYKDKYQRKNMVSLCFSDEEISKIDAVNNFLNVPRATAIREIIIDDTNKILSKIKKNQNQDLVLSLNKIGNNLNQITKKINSNLELFINNDDAENFASSIDDLNSLFKDILRRLKWYIRS